MFYVPSLGPSHLSTNKFNIKCFHITANFLKLIYEK